MGKATIAVLGSGVAGAAITQELARRGHQVISLYRRPYEGSSFTNQKWQHSGLLYPNERVARSAWDAYQKMDPLLKRFIINRWARARFLALEEKTLVERKRWWHEWNVKSWGIDWRCLESSEYEEIGVVGSTNTVGGLETPDCIIDFPELVAHLRNAAKAEGAQVIEGANVQRLIVDKRNARIVGLEYETGEGFHEIDCDQCIVAMGAWSVTLLQKSGVVLPPIVRKKCIVLAYEGELVPCITVCLDVRKKNGETGDATLVPFKGRTLAAGTGWERTSHPDEQNMNDVDVEYLVDELVQCFPRLRDWKSTPHICIKTERDTEGRAPDVSRRIYGKADLGVERLTLVLPGKASFMFELAKDVAQRF